MIDLKINDLVTCGKRHGRIVMINGDQVVVKNFFTDRLFIVSTTSSNILKDDSWMVDYVNKEIEKWPRWKQDAAKEIMEGYRYDD